MLLTMALLCICLLGYLAQSTGLCMVRGVKEWKAGNREFLLAVLFSGAWAWVAILVSQQLNIQLQFLTFEASFWFLFGGIIFGLGTALNQGCGVSTLGKLTRGDIKMLPTIVGWVIGWSLLGGWRPFSSASPSPVPETTVFILLVIMSLAITIWAALGNSERKKLWFSMMGVGLLAGFLYLYEPNWPPSGLLNQLSGALINESTSSWPSIEQISLFMLLLIGMFIAAWHNNKINVQLPNIRQWIIHLLAGILMGVGASLAQGGNDAQLLLALPAFSPGGLGAVIGILFGIWLGLYIRKKAGH
jgi:uncharacterized membrane protein YedE/YeeE